MNLVSREKAIDVAIDEYNRGYKEGFEAGKSSVSGDGDLIDRQAAIDAAKEELDNGTFYDIPSKIKYLPPALPEVIRCKDCRWFDSEINQCDRQICAVFYDDDYCSYAERKIDE